MFTDVRELIQVVDDTGKKFIFEPDKISSTEILKVGTVNAFLKRKGCRHILKVKHSSYKNVDIMTYLAFNKSHRAMATKVRLTQY